MICGRCSRQLTSKKSIDLGYGPTCNKKHDVPFRRASTTPATAHSSIKDRTESNQLGLAEFFKEGDKHGKVQAVTLDLGPGAETKKRRQANVQGAG